MLIFWAGTKAVWETLRRVRISLTPCRFTPGERLPPAGYMNFMNLSLASSMT
jgi:hypothetical protein